MKKQILFLAAIFIAMTNANATQWSVSNSAQNPGQFSSIQAAITAMPATVHDNDTLLVHATNIGYAAFTLNHPLTIIGGGFNTNKNPQFITNITGVITLTTAASGSRFYGIKHTTITTSGATFVLNNVVFENCYGVGDMTFNGSGGFVTTNFVLRNCIENTISYRLGEANSAVMTNCIFTGFGPSTCSGNLLVSNCTFIGSSHLFQCQNVIVQNCVFQNSSFGNTTFNNSFNNCFFVNVTALSTTTPPLPVGNGTVSLPGNTGSKDSTMSTTPFVNNPNNSALAINGTRDYHITGNGLTYATDGGQIGVYGGTSKFSLTGEPLNSAITRSFTINNAVVPVNGNLNINLMVTKPVTQ